MAWLDIYNDVSILFPFDGSVDPWINTAVNPNANVILGPTGTTGTWTHYNDAPPGSPYAQSLRITNPTYSTVPKSRKLVLGQSQAYTNNYGYNSWGETINFWYKVVKTSGVDNIGPTFTIFKRENGTSDEQISVAGGTNYLDPTGNVGKLNWANHRYVTSASNAAALPTSAMLPTIVPEQWYNITITWITHQNANTINGKYCLERAIYINGMVAHNTYLNTTNGYDQLDNLEFLFSNSSSTNTQIMSSLAAWNRALTKSEIEALAFNNNVINDINVYNNLVTTAPNAANYYVTLNNPDKNTPTDVYGTNASWGALDDTPAGVTVNQESKFGKSWLLTTDGVASQEVDLTAGSTMNTEMSNLLAADSTGWSIECWVKSPQKSNTALRKVNVLYNSSYSANRIDWGINSIANGPSFVWATVPNWVSGNSYTSSNVLSSTNVSATQGNTKWVYATSSELKALLLHEPKGLDDGEWHHIVISYRGDGGVSDQGGRAQLASVFFDGLMTGYVSLSATSSANQLTSAFLNVFFGHPSNSSLTATPLYIDKYAVYGNGRLTLNEINKHWVTGKAYINQQASLVKYWDGTQWATSSAQKVWNGMEWIDWDAKYWDGNSWITV